MAIDLEILPEVRWANFIDGLGAFDADDDGDIYQKQIGYFDESRLDDDERCLFIKKESDNTVPGDFHEDVTILMVFFSKTDKSDSINTNYFMTLMQNRLLCAKEGDDFFNCESLGSAGPIILDSGRHAYELRFRAMSNYQPTL